MDELEPNSQTFAVAAVIGTFPENLELACKLSVKALAVPERLWRFYVNSGDHWTFLNSFWRGIGITKRGILLASNPGLISTGSLFFMELEILHKLGYIADSTGTRLEFGRIQVGNATGQPPAKSIWGALQSVARKVFPPSSAGAAMQRKFSASGIDAEFEEKIRKSFLFLFQDCSGKVVSNQRFAAAFGNAILVLAAGTLLIRIVRDRDEVRVDVSPAHASTEWHLLTVALAALQSTTSNPSLASCSSVEQGAALLQSTFASVRAAFSPEHYEVTRNRMQAIEMAKLREWVSAFNPPAIRYNP